MITEHVFLFGCPHCGDGIPSLVTIMTHGPYSERIKFINVQDEVKEAIIKYGSSSIMSCRKLESEEE